MDGPPLAMVPAEAPPAGDSDLHEYLGILWRRRWSVVATVVLAVVLAGAYSVARPVRYEATAELQLQPQIPQALLQANGAPEQAQVNVPTEIAVIGSRAVATIARQSVPDAPPVSATEVGVTQEVALSVVSSDPRLAARAANAYADAYLTFQRRQTAAVLDAAAASLQQRLHSVDDLITLDQLELAQPALAPRAASGIDAALGSLQTEAATLGDRIGAYQQLASSPTGEAGRVVSAAPVPQAKVHSGRTLLLGLVGGLVLGIGLALLRESFARDAAARAAAATEGGSAMAPVTAQAARVPRLERAAGDP